MSLISLLVVLVIAGVAIYLVNTLVPMDAKFKTVFNALVGVILLLWILQQFGLLSSGPVLRLR